MSKKIGQAKSDQGGLPDRWCLKKKGVGYFGTRLKIGGRGIEGGGGVQSVLVYPTPLKILHDKAQKDNASSRLLFVDKFNYSKSHAIE